MEKKKQFASVPPKRGRPSLKRSRGRKIQLSFWATSEQKDLLLALLPRSLDERTIQLLSLLGFEEGDQDQN